MTRPSSALFQIFHDFLRLGPGSFFFWVCVGLGTESVPVPSPLFLRHFRRCFSASGDDRLFLFFSITSFLLDTSSDELRDDRSLPPSSFTFALFPQFSW